MAAKPSSPIPFIDLEAQQARLGTRVHDAMARVLAHGQYILGPEIAELEKQLATFCGVKHALSCASGTDALALVLASSFRAEFEGVKVDWNMAATCEGLA